MESSWPARRSSLLLLQGRPCPHHPHHHAPRCPRASRCCHQAGRHGHGGLRDVDLERVFASALTGSPGGRARRMRAPRPDSYEEQDALRPWPSRAMAALGRVMRLRNTWRRAGVRPSGASRSSQTTPTQTRPHITEAPSSPAMASAAASSPTVQSPTGSSTACTTASESCGSLAGAALGCGPSYLETVVKCTALDELSGPAVAIPDDPGGRGASSPTASDCEDVVACCPGSSPRAVVEVPDEDAVPSPEPPERLPEEPPDPPAEAQSSSPDLPSDPGEEPPPEATPLPTEPGSSGPQEPPPAQDGPAAASPADCGGSAASPSTPWWPWRSPPSSATAAQDGSLADTVRGVANILKALDEVGESIPRAAPRSTRARPAVGVEQGVHEHEHEHDDGAEHATAAGRGEQHAEQEQAEQAAVPAGPGPGPGPVQGDDSNLLMLALRQDGEHSVLLLTLLDKVAATDAKYDAEQLASLVRDCKSNMASLASALCSNKQPEAQHAVEDANKAAEDDGDDAREVASLTRVAAVQPSAVKTLGHSMGSASAPRAELSQVGGAVAKTTGPWGTSSLGAALAAPRAPSIGQPLARTLGDVVGDLRDSGEPQVDGDLASALGAVGDLGDHPINDKFRSVPPGPGARGPVLSGGPGGHGGPGGGRAAAALLEDAKRRVMFQSRPSELSRLPRAATNAKSQCVVAAAARCRLPRAAPLDPPLARARCARRGAAGVASASRVGVGIGVGVAGDSVEEVSTRARPRGCRLPSLLAQGPVVEGVAPHRVNKAVHQVAHHAAHHAAQRVHQAPRFATKLALPLPPPRSLAQRAVAVPPPESSLPLAALAALAAFPASTASVQRVARRSGKTLSVSFREPPR